MSEDPGTGLGSTGATTAVTEPRPAAGRLRDTGAMGAPTGPEGQPATDLGVPASRPRIRGVDAARAAAIIGMFAVHVGPTDADGVAGWLYALPHGRAAILFLLLAGVGVSLLAGSRTTSPAEARTTLAWRAVLLLPAGLALQLLDHGVFVILQDYAVLFVFGIVVLGLGERWLLALAATSVTFGPLVYLWGRINATDAFQRASVEWTDPAGEIVHGLLLSGPYPFITWAAPFLAGMWIGRRDLRDPEVRAWLIFGGGSVAVLTPAASRILVGLLGPPGDPVGWTEIVVARPHSQMPLWLLGSTGAAVFVLGVSLMAADRARRLLWPIVAAGQLALTVYVAHLLVLHYAAPVLRSGEVGRAAAVVAGFSIAGALFATAWRARFARGPLEVVLRGPRRGRGVLVEKD